MCASSWSTITYCNRQEAFAVYRSIAYSSAPLTAVVTRTGEFARALRRACRRLQYNDAADMGKRSRPYLHPVLWQTTPSGLDPMSPEALQGIVLPPDLEQRLRVFAISIRYAALQIYSIFALCYILRDRQWKCLFVAPRRPHENC